MSILNSYARLCGRCHSLIRSQIFPRQQWISRSMSSVSPKFEEAKQRLNSLKEDPGNAAKLKLYALYKQATTGKVNIDRPGMFDLVGRTKWDVWNALGDISKDEAQQQYVGYVNELAGKAEAVVTSTAVDSKYQHLEVSVSEGLRVIKLNRPTKMNALLKEMYDELVDALAEAAADDKTVITATTGAGHYYCSGNDLSNFANVSGDLSQVAKDSGVLLNRFVSAFIDFPKPLVAVVNGPAIGVSVTVMGLYDAVYASDKATFHTPFSNLGQSPEGCSSYTFPRIMGPGKASELLLFNKKLTAQEACDVGLVTKVFPDHCFKEEVWSILAQLAKLPIKSLVYSKVLTRDFEKDILHKVNDAECERLVERWQSDDCMNAIMSYFSKKSKM